MPGTDMSLKAFHLFFIAISVILAAFTAAWAVNEYRFAHEASYIVTTVGAVLTGAALAVYGIKFQQKAKRLL